MTYRRHTLSPPLLLVLALAAALLVAWALVVGGANALPTTTPKAAPAPRAAMEKNRKNSERRARVPYSARATTARSVEITSRLASPSTETKATIRFLARGSRRVECSLDGARFARCASPVTYADLVPGSHHLVVRVRAGKTTASDSLSWSVIRMPKPDPAPTPAPPVQAPSAPAAPPVTPPTDTKPAVGSTAAGQKPDTSSSATTASVPASPAPASAAVPQASPSGGVAATAAAPAPYPLPANALRVSTSVALKSALDTSPARDIVLENGVYDNSDPFYNPNGHRLYAASPGGAVLRAGISVGGNWGPGNAVVRGLAFDVSDRARTLHGSIIHVWGTGKGSRILDVTLEGHRTIGAGIAVRQPEGVVIQRVVARNFLDYGVMVDMGDPNATVSDPPLLEDIDVTGVSRPAPRSSNGTAEACVWIGNTVILRRLRTSDCAWEGLWVGTAARNATFEDVRVSDTGVGVYMEHFVQSSTFRRLQIGPNVDRGVTCEWADPAWGSRPACTDNVIERSYFDTRHVGVYLDEGTTRTTVRSSTFVGQCWAAIGNYKGIGNLGDTAGNDYRGMQPRAVQVSPSHYYSRGC